MPLSFSSICRTGRTLVWRLWRLRVPAPLVSAFPALAFLGFAFQISHPHDHVLTSPERADQEQKGDRMISEAGVVAQSLLVEVSNAQS